MDYFIQFEDGSDGYLSHHGVLGMKWGVRNAETQARYRRDGLDLKLYPKDSSYEGHQALWLRDESEETKREAARLNAASADLMNRYNDAWNAADSELKRLSKDPQTKKEALSIMKKELVSYGQVDDAELAEIVAFDAADAALRKRAASSPKGKEVTKYEQELKNWFSDAKATTDRIVAKNGNKEIRLNFSEKTDYEKVVHNTLLQAQDSGFHSYAARHGIWDEVVGNSDYTDQLAAQVLTEFKKTK